MSDALPTMTDLVLSYDTVCWYVPGEGHFLEWFDATGSLYTCLIDEGQECLQKKMS